MLPAVEAEEAFLSDSALRAELLDLLLDFGGKLGPGQASHVLAFLNTCAKVKYVTFGATDEGTGMLVLVGAGYPEQDAPH